ncbi:MAG: thioesterase [Oscillospiraceae bacterium]
MESGEAILTESTYSRGRTLDFSNCDRWGRARVSTLLSFLAGVSGEDYDARGLPYERLYALRQTFLLSRVTLHVLRLPRLGEYLRVATWENGAKGVYLLRDYELTDAAGAVCVAARSNWILVNPETRKILRPESFTGKVLGRDQRVPDCPACGKVLAPRDGLEDLGARTMVYSNLDRNGHVYSGNYGDFFWDALPQALQEREPETFSINYHKEARQGETLRLAGARTATGYRMSGEKDDGLCFTADCTWRENGE